MTLLIEKSTIASDLLNTDLNNFKSYRKKSILRFLFTIILGHSFFCQAKTASTAIIKSGSARFTILTPTIIRMEYAGDSVFENASTFNVLTGNYQYLYIKRRLMMVGWKFRQQNNRCVTKLIQVLFLLKI